jgi:hypothetical protein
MQRMFKKYIYIHVLQGERLAAFGQYGCRYLITTVIVDVIIECYTNGILTVITSCEMTVIYQLYVKTDGRATLIIAIKTLARCWYRMQKKREDNLQLSDTTLSTQLGEAAYTAVWRTTHDAAAYQDE